MSEISAAAREELVQAVGERYREETAEAKRRILDEFVALSGYHSPLMRQLYSDWHYVEAPERLVHSVKMPRTEVLWTNYEITGEDVWQTQIHNTPLQTRFAEQPACNAVQSVCSPTRAHWRTSHNSVGMPAG